MLGWGLLNCFQYLRIQLSNPTGNFFFKMAFKMNIKDLKLNPDVNILASFWNMLYFGPILQWGMLPKQFFAIFVFLH